MNDNEPRAGQEAIINHVRAFGQQVAQETLRKISDEAPPLTQIQQAIQRAQNQLRTLQQEEGTDPALYSSSEISFLPQEGITAQSTKLTIGLEGLPIELTELAVYDHRSGQIYLHTLHQENLSETETLATEVLVGTDCLAIGFEKASRDHLGIATLSFSPTQISLNQVFGENSPGVIFLSPDTPTLSPLQLASVAEKNQEVVIGKSRYKIQYTPTPVTVTTNYPHSPFWDELLCRFGIIEKAMGPQTASLPPEPGSPLIFSDRKDKPESLTPTEIWEILDRTIGDRWTEIAKGQLPDLDLVDRGEILLLSPDQRTRIEIRVDETWQRMAVQLPSAEPDGPRIFVDFYMARQPDQNGVGEITMTCHYIAGAVDLITAFGIDQNRQQSFTHFVVPIGQSGEVMGESTRTAFDPHLLVLLLDKAFETKGLCPVFLQAGKKDSEEVVNPQFTALAERLNRMFTTTWAKLSSLAGNSAEEDNCLATTFQPDKISLEIERGDPIHHIDPSLTLRRATDVRRVFFKDSGLTFAVEAASNEGNRQKFLITNDLIPPVLNEFGEENPPFGIISRPPADTMIALGPMAEAIVTTLESLTHQALDQAEKEGLKVEVS